MFHLSRQTVRRHGAVYAGSFVALAVGVLLLGLAATATAATIAYDGGPGDSITVTVTGTDTAPREVRVPLGEDVAGLQVVLSMIATISGFITIFVIASTFAFAVASRRRELGLLRLIGATPRQVRRMIRGEALVVALAAAFVGALLAHLTTPLLLAKASYTDLAPVRLEPASPWGPLAIAMGVGLGVAVLGARSAAKRASRVGPVDALREAALEPPRIGWMRLGFGLLLLGGSLALLALIRPGTGEAVIPLAMFIPMLLVVALTALGPVVVPVTGWLLAIPLVRYTHASGRLARSNVVAAPRRSASLAAPVLAIAAIGGSLVLTFSFAADASVAMVRDTLRSPIVVTAGDDTTDLRSRIENSPGLAVSDGPLPVRLIRTDRDDATIDDAEGIDLADASRTRKLVTKKGDLADLTGKSVAIGQTLAGEDGYRVGDPMKVTFLDGKKDTLRVVAVLRDAPEVQAGLLLPTGLAAEHGTGRPSRWFVQPAEGVDPATLTATLDQNLAGTGADAVPAGQWVAQQDEQLRAGNRFGLILLLGPAALYSAIAIVNTLLMGSMQRRQEFVASRLLGATPAQLGRMVLWESGLVGLVALTLGTAITVTVGLLLRNAITDGLPNVPTTVPWFTLLGIAATCLTLAVGAALAPTTFVLRATHPSTALTQ